MRPNKYDFSGWVTKNNIGCSDGRTILRDAFAQQNETYVPLVWAHDHDNPENTLGKIFLENRPEGVYGYGIFNNSRRALASKEAVAHGDVVNLSIWANHLKQDDKRNVSHGKIREVSLVLAGANPGALIDFALAHGDEDAEETQAIIYSSNEDGLELMHEENTESTEKEEDPKNMNENEKNNVVEHEDGEGEGNEKTLKQMFDEAMGKLTETEQKVILAMIGLAAQMKDEKAAQSDDDEEHIEHTDNNTKEENPEMKKNVFDKTTDENEFVLTHDDEVKIIEKAKQCGSLKEAIARCPEYLSHSVDDTVIVPQHTDNILIPEPKAAPGQPVTIDRRQEWVKFVMNNVNKVPFARVKIFGFDITPDEARAKGYVTGAKKVDEVISMFRRSTDPTTVYKKQSLDRDQLLDISDFDIVRYLYSEMEGKLDEELARAYLFGDGRSAVSADKIDETKIRPIWTDDSLFTIVKRLEYAENDTETAKLKKFIAACIKARKDYRGKGNPACFMSEDQLANLLLLEDAIGHKLYADEAALARALRVSQIVPVPVMEGLKREDDGVDYDLKAIIVNLGDYTVGNNKGGEKTWFKDFDIDYNKEKYLIETRRSAALTAPYSAIVIEAPSEEEAAAEEISG